MAVIARSNGVRSRNAILNRGLEVAAAGGLAAATIGALAVALGMSKSGVFAHFGSKDALDLAVIDAAADRFTQAVVAPAGAAPPGIATVAALCEGFLAFVAGPSDGTPRLTPEHPAFGVAGAATARARLERWRDAWQQALSGAVMEGIARGELTPSRDAAQLVFEIQALLEAAARAMRHQPAALVATRTRTAVDRLLIG